MSRHASSWAAGQAKQRQIDPGPLQVTMREIERARRHRDRLLGMPAFFQATLPCPKQRK
jgi:hypothetical protein